MAVQTSITMSDSFSTMNDVMIFRVSYWTRNSNWLTSILMNCLKKLLILFQLTEKMLRSLFFSYS